jgi:hypothetical protein
MVSESWIRALTRAGVARAEAGRTARVARAAADIEAAFGGAVSADARTAGVRVAARGLSARVFGSRRRAPDPRLAWLAAWLTMGGY